MHHVKMNTYFQGAFGSDKQAKKVDHYQRINLKSSRLAERFSAFCKICGKSHILDAHCPSKPRYPPHAYFSKCTICLGYHPKGQCYFEFMRESLFTPTPCKNCYGLVHIGFCNDAVLCQRCDTKHNAVDGCSKVDDLSNNLCPKCDRYHTLHCPQDLARVQIAAEFWCNRCKIIHDYMRCTPHCAKCFQRHSENFTCPWPYPIFTKDHQKLLDNEPEEPRTGEENLTSETTITRELNPEFDLRQEIASHFEYIDDTVNDLQVTLSPNGDTLYVGKFQETAYKEPQ